MLWIGGDIPNLIGVALDVVKLLDRLWLPKDLLHVIQLTSIELTLPSLSRGGLEHVIQIRSLGAIGHKVSDVEISVVSKGARAIDPFIHAVAKAVEVSIGVNFWSKKGSTMQPFGRRQLAKIQNRWQQIHKCHQPRACGTFAIHGLKPF